MLPRLAFRIYRDRRRLFFVTGLAFLAGFIMYLRADLYVGVWHVSWITGALYATIVGFCAMIVCVILPSMRFMIEAVAVSRLVLSLVIFAVPGAAPILLGDPFVTATVTVGLGLVISRLMHGQILKDRAAGWRRWVLPAQGFQRVPARINASPLQVRFVGWIDDMTPQAAKNSPATL